MTRKPANEGGESPWAPLLDTAMRVAERAAAHPAVQQVGAAALQLGASCAAFNLTLAVTHVTAGCLRIHCATPLLAPLWGAASVAAASVAAGHVSRSALAALRLSYVSYRDHHGGGCIGRGRGDGKVLGGRDGGDGDGGGRACAMRALTAALAALPRQLLASWDGREALVDAMVGPFVYKVLFGHSFTRLLPSHLAHPGAFGRLHIPTGPTEYSTATEKAQLSIIFGRDGCHHCGTRINGVIGDHMPPYKVVKDVMAAREAAGGLDKLLVRVADFLGLKDEGLKQVYYAQCRACSGRQAQLMRHGTRATALPGVWPPQLVVHSPASLATRPAMPGVLVGMRYYIDASVRQGPVGGPYGGEVAGAAPTAGDGGNVRREGSDYGGGGKRSRGWRWLWEQRPRMWKESCGGGGLGVGAGIGTGMSLGEVVLVLSSGGPEEEDEANGDADAGGDDGCGFDQGRGLPELFLCAHQLSTMPLLMSR